MMINLALLTSPNGTVVGTINATDPDNNPLTYSITDGNPDTDGDNIKAFAIRSCRVRVCGDNLWQKNKLY